MYVYAVCDDVRENLQLEKEEEEESDFFSISFASAVASNNAEE